MGRGRQAAEPPVADGEILGEPGRHGHKAAVQESERRQVGNHRAALIEIGLGKAVHAVRLRRGDERQLLLDGVLVVRQVPVEIAVLLHQERAVALPVGRVDVGRHAQVRPANAVHVSAIPIEAQVPEDVVERPVLHHQDDDRADRLAQLTDGERHRNPPSVLAERQDLERQ